MSVVNQIPKSEDGYGVKYTTESGNEYVISHNKIKKRFTALKSLLHITNNSRSDPQI